MNTTFLLSRCAVFIMPGSSRAALAQYPTTTVQSPGAALDPKLETTKPIGNSLEKEKHVQVCV
ncbi:MAG: hypothetical protein ACOH2S_28080 [Janthinobacterium svalbardensis]|uniref:hypothetical protein n=1 Tax=Janthinobacterium svalbardensis TaxID=368607 RepID=UPI00142E4FC8|nr:hypothetical protein [Janthinobacterium svalbardensis]